MGELGAYVWSRAVIYDCCWLGTAPLPRTRNLVIAWDFSNFLLFYIFDAYPDVFHNAWITVQYNKICQVIQIPFVGLIQKKIIVYNMHILLNSLLP
jgi:hypothetical protein